MDSRIGTRVKIAEHARAGVPTGYCSDGHVTARQALPGAIPPVSFRVTFERHLSSETAHGWFRHDELEPEFSSQELFDADANCFHDIETLWSGVKCRKCPGWHCL